MSKYQTKEQIHTKEKEYNHYGGVLLAIDFSNSKLVTFKVHRLAKDTRRHLNSFSSFLVFLNFYRKPKFGCFSVRSKASYIQMILYITTRFSGTEATIICTASLI